MAKSGGFGGGVEIKKKKWPLSSSRTPVVKEVERDGLRERDG